VVPSRKNLIAGTLSPAFLVDPVILDAAGQVVAFWSQERLTPHGDIFPFRMTALKCYRPPSPEGTKLDCRVFAYHVDEREIRSHIEIVGVGGELHYRIEGWHDRRFTLPRSLWDLRVSAGATMAGRIWTSGPPDAVCVSVEDFTDELLASSHGIWLKTVAALVLGPAERKQWQALSGAVPRRRHDWLRGRCAAKDAVRHLVKLKRGVELKAADVEILPDTFGKPCVSGPWTRELGIQPAVSLTHTTEKAVAIAAEDAAVLLGIDVEDLTVERNDWARLAFEPAEIEHAPGHDAHAKREWLLRMWCAKEAAGKALGRGLSHGLNSLRIVRVERESGVVHMELANGLVEQFPALAGTRLAAQTERVRNLVFSTVVHRVQKS
jgi:phosphopantetheinyl transferase